MLFVVDIPLQGDPRAWFAFDQDDLARKMASMPLEAGQRITYLDEADAVGAFEGGDPRIAGKENWRARRALYGQLIALDVLADDC